MFPLDSITLPNFVEGDENDTHFESIFRGKPSKGKKHYTTLMASFDTKTQALKRYYQAYLASVAFMDEQVGKILTALENSRFKDNTIVVFTSDHGYNLGEKENLFKNNLWERSTRVPLIIYDSRTNTKQSINAPVSLVDLFPTFTDYANAVSDNRKNDKGLPITGNSLLPLIQGNDSIERHALTVVRTGGDKGGQSHFALRTENWRYILYANGKEELYDHKSDSDEIYNLALDNKYQDVKHLLKHQLLELTADAK